MPTSFIATAAELVGGQLNNSPPPCDLPDPIFSFKWNVPGQTIRAGAADAIRGKEKRHKIVKLQLVHRYALIHLAAYLIPTLPVPSRLGWVPMPVVAWNT